LVKAMIAMIFRNASRFMAVSAVLVVGTVLTACGASHGAQSPGASPVHAHLVSARLVGIPSTIKVGVPVQFTATLTNRSSVGQHDVAPLFQIVGGACNCALGSLERFSSATGAWQAVPMPEGDGDPNFLTRATGGTTLSPGASVTFRYRLILAAANPAKSLHAVLYAVQLPTGTQLALISVPTQLTTG
jgi:hypothetical protein